MNTPDDVTHAILLLNRGREGMHPTEAIFCDQVMADATGDQLRAIADQIPADVAARLFTPADNQKMLFPEGDYMPQMEIGPQTATQEAENGLF